MAEPQVTAGGAVVETGGLEPPTPALQMCGVMPRQPSTAGQGDSRSGPTA
jgi:hypothetical protein